MILKYKACKRVVRRPYFMQLLYGDLGWISQLRWDSHSYGGF